MEHLSTRRALVFVWTAKARHIAGVLLVSFQIFLIVSAIFRSSIISRSFRSGVL